MLPPAINRLLIKYKQLALGAITRTVFMFFVHKEEGRQECSNIFCIVSDLCAKQKSYVMLFESLFKSTQAHEF